MFCLYYRYMDLLLYLLSVIASMLLLTLFPCIVGAFLCGGSYLLHHRDNIDRIEKEASQVMGWIHLLLGGCVLLIMMLL